ESAAATAQPVALLQRPRRRRAAHQAAQRGLRPGQHPQPPLLRQRDVLPSAPARLQSRELVQAALLAAGIPARYPADPAAADPPDARPVESHPEPSPSGLAHKRPPGSRVEVCPSADELAQAVTEPLFTPDSGEIHNLLETYPNRKIILTGAND